MATIEQPQTAGTIEVENPATGQVVRSLRTTTPDAVEAMVARARAAQPAWEALGYEGRGRVLRTMRRWLIDNSERVIETIVSETGKTYEDASVAEVAYCAGACGRSSFHVVSTYSWAWTRRLSTLASRAGCANAARPWRSTSARRCGPGAGDA